jgi:tetratricopeptide (TPR) repeat protein
MEQTDVPANAGPHAAVVSSPRTAYSAEVRASMEAIRVAREAAFVRARRQTLRTRLWFATSLAAIAVAAVAFGPRLPRWWQARQARVHAPISAHPALRAPERKAAPAIGSPAAGPVVAGGPAGPVVAGGPTGPVVADGPAAPVARPEAEDNPAAAPAACDTTSLRHAWRLSPEACARAFEADPTNARLALAVAQAEHAHAHVARAAEWAERALALDPNAAEAYVIIARAHAESGRDDDARAAYQRYLDLAPRGWHRPEARAALQRAGSTHSAGGR